MHLRTKVLVVGAIVAGFLLSAHPAAAVTAGELQNLKIIGHHFTTTIASGIRTVSTTDPSKARFLVLKVAAVVPGKSAVAFAPDFVLVYSHADGSEDRATCDAIGEASTGTPGEFSAFHIGTVPRLTLPGGQVYFGLAFLVEPDVVSVELHPLGGPPMSYSVGPDRKYSVYLTTNTNPKLLSDVQKVIQEGGYQVTAATGQLNQEQTGVIIHYADKAESEAQEISQRLTTQLKLTPTLKKMELISEVDIVIWLGK